MRYLVGLIACLPLSACSISAHMSHQPAPSAAPSAATSPEPPRLGLPNPASAFCLQQGGTLRIVRTAQGEHGMCKLPDGREVEEWTFFRQHRPQP